MGFDGLGTPFAELPVPTNPGRHLCLAHPRRIKCVDSNCSPASRSLWEDWLRSLPTPAPSGRSPPLGGPPRESVVLQADPRRVLPPRPSGRRRLRRAPPLRRAHLVRARPLPGPLTLLLRADLRRRSPATKLRVLRAEVPGARLRVLAPARPRPTGSRHAKRPRGRAHRTRAPAPACATCPASRIVRPLGLRILDPVDPKDLLAPAIPRRRRDPGARAPASGARVCRRLSRRNRAPRSRS